MTNSWLGTARNLYDSTMIKSTNLLLLFSVFVTGCASSVSKINWDDPRCFTKTDYEKKYQAENNKAAALAALLSGDTRNALIYSGNSGITWEEGLTGDNRKLWVGYSDDNRVIGYSDQKGIDLSVAEMNELGGVVTRRSNFQANDVTFIQKRLLGFASPDYGKPVLARKRPESCNK